MYIDGLLQFSSAQALTTTAVSTNVIDLLNPRDMGLGEDPTLDIVAQVVTTFTGGTSIQAVLQGSVDNSTFTDMVSGPVVTTANAAQGAQLANFADADVGSGSGAPALPAYQLCDRRYDDCWRCYLDDRSRSSGQPHVCPRHRDRQLRESSRWLSINC
jgi:hypothetical protein